MKIEKSELIKSAKDLIGLVLESAGQELVYQELCAREPRLKKRTLEEFLSDYVPAKLALACVYWVGCCLEHGIDDKDLKNICFKEVMSLFESPKSLQNATKFSECLYASNADPEQSPVLGVLVHLFHKLDLEAIVKPGDDDAGQLNFGFTFMMEVCEALKNFYENKFSEFYYSQDVITAPVAKRKA